MSEFIPTAALSRLYADMERRLAIVRRRLARPLTLADKILLGHLDAPETQALVPGESQLALRVDRVVFQDVLGQTGMLQFMQTGRDRVAVPASIHCDHLIQARVEGRADLSASLAENREVYTFLRSAAAKYGLGFWEPGAGIIHQVVLEHYAFPGALLIGTDSHTPNAGGLGACAIGVGGADAVEALAGLPWEVLYPRRIAVYRIHRPGCAHDQRNRQGDHHQHGRGAGRNHLAVPRRRAHGRLSARDGTRGPGAARRGARDAARTRPRSRTGSRSIL